MSQQYYTLLQTIEMFEVRGTTLTNRLQKGHTGRKGRTLEEVQRHFQKEAHVSHTSKQSHHNFG